MDKKEARRDTNGYVVRARKRLFKQHESFGLGRIV